MKLRNVGAAMTLVGLLLVACGGDSGSTTTAGTNSATIEVAARSFAFTPDLWTVPSGAEVTLNMTNQSDTLHEWVVLSTPIESEDEFSEDLVIWEVEAEAGATATDSFTAPAAGTYQVICALEGHFSAGMNGELVVTG